jgi:hypothetical protein
MTAFRGSRSKAPSIPNLGARRTLRPLSLPERNPSIHRIGGCVRSSASLEVLVKRKVYYPWRDSNPGSSSPYFDWANPAPCPHNTSIFIALPLKQDELTNWVSCGGQCAAPTTACCLRFTDGSRRVCLLYSGDWYFVFYVPVTVHHEKFPYNTTN